MSTTTGSAKAFAQSGRERGFEAISAGSSQVLAISNASVASAAFGANTTIVRLFATQDCFLEFGASPTVTGSSYFLPGGIVDFVGVNGGSKIAALQWTANGSLFITEGAQ